MEAVVIWWSRMAPWNAITTLVSYRFSYYPGFEHILRLAKTMCHHILHTNLFYYVNSRMSRSGTGSNTRHESLWTCLGTNVSLVYRHGPPIFQWSWPWSAVRKAGYTVGKKRLQILTESMPRRVRTVAAARGRHTWYCWYLDMLSPITNLCFVVHIVFTVLWFHIALHWPSSSHDTTEIWVSALP